MMSHRREPSLEIPTRRAFVNITPQLSEALAESGIREGLALVNAMQLTASGFINDDEPGLPQDDERWLEGLAPLEPVSQCLHNRTGEDNGDAQLKRQVMGRDGVVAMTDGNLDIGPREQSFRGEFDGRHKRILIKISGA